LQTKIQEAKEKVGKAELELQNYRKKSRIVTDSTDKGISMFQQLLQKKAELEISLSENLEYYKEKHPEIIGIKSELDSVEKKIETEKEKELKVKDKQIRYTVLKRDVDTNQEIYESLLKRIGETEVTGELKTTNIRVIDKATVPTGTVRPKIKKNLLIAFLVGLMGGGGLAFLFEGLDQSINTPEDIKNYLRLPALASIALPKEEDDKIIQPEFISSKKPRSTISESYRGLRTSIMFTAVEHKRKTLLLTSSGPQEGKTTNAINLAIVMAQSGEKTLLLDADLRQPRVEKAFGIKSEHGLTELLVGKENFDTVVRRTDIENLDIVTCGAIPPNPSELLGSKKMNELLQTLEGRYDRIIIDSPPVLAVTDAVVLSGKVDGSIIVVRAGETNRNAVLKTREIMESLAASNVIGVILNMVETGKTGGHYYYYHYYGKYGKYGHKDEKKQTSKKHNVVDLVKHIAKRIEPILHREKRT
ncbi:polysaccharide biosynthesis tyrosine autokinase, partial [Candidatus Omnitrophota bacterium]